MLSQRLASHRLDGQGYGSGDRGQADDLGGQELKDIDILGAEYFSDAYFL
ncbi:hypothetical protein ACQ86N_06160 [Puia sp. P3]